jgi:hypothetical protein
MEENGKVRSEMEGEKQVTMRGNSARQEQLAGGWAVHHAMSS